MKKAQQKLADVAGLLRWVREHCQPKVEFVSHVPNTVSTGKWLKQIMPSTPPPLPSPADLVPTSSPVADWSPQADADLDSPPAPPPLPTDGVLPPPPPPPPQWLAPLVPEGVEVGCVAPCMADLTAQAFTHGTSQSNRIALWMGAHMWKHCA